MDLTAAMLPSCTKGQLLSLVGGLEWLEPIVRGSAAFLQPLWVQLYNCGPPTDGKDNRPANVKAGSFADRSLREWKLILTARSFKWAAKWGRLTPSTIFVAITDAAGELSKTYTTAGFAIVIGNLVIKGRFTPEELNDTDMSLKELTAYRWFTKRYGPQLTGMVLLGISDNLSGDYEGNRQRSKQVKRFELFIDIARDQREHDFDLLFEHQTRNLLPRHPDYYTRGQ